MTIVRAGIHHKGIEPWVKATSGPARAKFSRARMARRGRIAWQRRRQPPSRWAGKADVAELSRPRTGSGKKPSLAGRLFYWAEPRNSSIAAVKACGCSMFDKCAADGIIT